MEFIFGQTVGHTSLVSFVLIKRSEVEAWVTNTGMFSADVDYRQIEFRAYAKSSSDCFKDQLSCHMLWKVLVTKRNKNIEGMPDLLRRLRRGQSLGLRTIQAWDAGLRIVHIAVIKPR